MRLVCPERHVHLSRSSRFQHPRHVVPLLCPWRKKIKPCNYAYLRKRLTCLLGFPSEAKPLCGGLSSPSGGGGGGGNLRARVRGTWISLPFLRLTHTWQIESDTVSRGSLSASSHIHSSPSRGREHLKAAVHGACFFQKGISSFSLL